MDGSCPTDLVATQKVEVTWRITIIKTTGRPMILPPRTQRTGMMQPATLPAG